MIYAYRYEIKFPQQTDAEKEKTTGISDFYAIVLASNGENAKTALRTQFTETGVVFNYHSRTDVIIQTN